MEERCRRWDGAGGEGEGGGTLVPTSWYDDTIRRFNWNKMERIRDLDYRCWFVGGCIVVLVQPCKHIPLLDMGSSPSIMGNDVLELHQLKMFPTS